MEITVADKKFTLNFHIRFWRELFTMSGITPMNLHNRINDDPGATISNIIWCAIPSDQRKGLEQSWLEENLDFRVIDPLIKQLSETLPKGPKNEQ